MRHISLTQDQWYRLRVYGHRVRLEAQQLRWQATQARQRAGLVQLAQHMPDANPLILDAALAIFTQQGLWPDHPPPVPRHTAFLHRPPR
jgi:hypothetical protein